MIDLFQNVRRHKRPLIHDPKLERTLYLLEGDIFELVSYYYTTNRYVKRPNMLITLLENMYNNPEDKVEQILTENETNVNFIIKDLGITSEIDAGKIHKGVITKNYYEIFVKTSDANVITMDKDNYLTFNPITIKYFDMVLTEPIHPKNIINPSYGYDYIVYEIDPVMLNLQYYFWCKEQIDLDKDIDPGRFLYTIALPNMIDDFFNGSLVLLYLSVLANYDYPLYVVDNPINIPTRLRDIKQGIGNVMEKYQHSDNYRYEELLDNMRLMNGNGSTFLEDKVKIYNSYNTWTFWLKYIDVIEFLLTTSTHRTLSMNKDTIEQLKKDIKYSLNNKHLDKIKHPILGKLEERLENIYKEY